MGGSPRCIIIFFHGYHSNGSAMQDAMEQLSALLPEARIYSPNGLTDLHKPQDGGAYSWFDVEDMVDHPDSAKTKVRATLSAAAVNQCIDQIIAAEGIAPDKVILAGYSQGATMALYAGVLREQQVGGVFSLSGGALDRIEEPKSKPPLMLAAGGDEESFYSGKQHALQAETALRQAGFCVACTLIPHQGHDLTPAAIELLADFARQTVLNKMQSDAVPRNSKKSGGFKP